ncbi:nucleotidyl transferase AbiEii/AbiGii toxin family protein [Pyrococcus abyssi]|uniref:Uncharacterized protein n=1 Tax=Pyrococcus abyssi (strain GE5 / Orsay) TaxID=272844 RepID=Q9V2N3_PYRAB|nr:nucleotidyl transferase AbiEii/AbiGii toxin family protein [Pyrococcus abyssi]CAB48965.1 Hypothetical protein PAB2322 [Pyrococcus abyssi GE5]CCE69413.1 TPA: hypothetical protein PAB2322 [Pyrococcus abyssi GE5]
MRTSGAPLKIKIDLTKNENELILLPLKKKRILHPYSDSDECNANIIVYSLEEIFAEKIRSLFQRTRPRDLYDVWKLKDMVKMDTVINILPDKFRIKNVHPNLKSLKEREDYYKVAWQRSLVHQINPLPKFEKVWNDVLEFLEELF